VADKDDKCPDLAGMAKYNGCPIPDTDNDGVNDEEDKCITVPGVRKYNGCPIPDSDNDAVNDEEDACPNVPGIAANRGCPEIKAEVKKKIDVAANNILFATGSARLAASSNKGLNEVVKIMQEDADVLLAIDGHTDDVGKEEFNQTLSESRAASVKQYLVGKGIDESRITSAGHGETSPIADNKSAAGRKKNRRVELVLSYYR
ncbi:MAG: OmpA family protein, partial [Pedobacter sp.]